jgi:pseudouridine kinase
MRKPRLLGIGGAHIDRRGTMNADYIYGASIPGQMIEEPGGGVFNALRTACQFEIECALLSVRGGDAAGEIVATEIKRSGIADLSAVFLDRTTASYTALLTQGGDVVAALADMSIYETALPRQISRRKTREAIAASDAILLDANMPEDAIVRLVHRCQGKQIYAMAISPAKALRLRPVLSRISCLFLNQREARSILALNTEYQMTVGLDLTTALSEAGLTRCVMTNGADELCVVDDRSMTLMKPVKVKRVIDVTGAGDAMAGATIAALLKGRPLTEAVKYGLAAATLTVETAQATANFANLERFAQILAQMNP